MKGSRPGDGGGEVTIAEDELTQLRAENLELRKRLAELDAIRRWMDEAGELSEVLDSMREGLQILDASWRYVYVNEAAAQHGRQSKEALLGRRLPELYPGVEETELFAALRRCLVERIASRMDNEFVFPDGSSEWFELRIQPVPAGVLVLSIDVGERRKLQAQLAHAQKMEAVGRLAGGVAHDFNNLLTIITSYAEFIGDALAPENPARNDVTQIRSAAERGAALTRQLLALSRRQVVEPGIVIVDEALEALLPMLRRLVGERVQVEVAAGGRDARIRMDPGQLDQILLNLAANARDAMSEGGRLTLRTETVRLDQSYADLHPEVSPGAYLMIAVSDTGCGIAPEALPHIFEPFFTTKAPGQGTGLGLATSHGIIRQFGGHIWVYSEPGLGTTFKLYFPLTRESQQTLRVEAAPPADLRGQETVMVVDDDESLRVLCSRVLREHGYTVLEAETPSEALRFSERYSGPIHVLITDTVMPELNGPELAQRLTQRRPDMQVLYMSGYVDHALLHLIHSERFLEKPFNPEGLARKLRQMLAAPVNA
jgi:two-component system cell cycle sensor histidine kinase/response regulator CckA